MLLGELLGNAVGKPLVGRVRLVIELSGSKDFLLKRGKRLEFLLKRLDYDMSFTGAVTLLRTSN